MSEEDVARAMAGAASMDFVDLGQIDIPAEVIELVPAEAARATRWSRRESRTPG